MSLDVQILSSIISYNINKLKIIILLKKFYISKVYFLKLIFLQKVQFCNTFKTNIQIQFSLRF